MKCNGTHHVSLCYGNKGRPSGTQGAPSGAYGGTHGGARGAPSGARGSHDNIQGSQGGQRSIPARNDPPTGPALNP